MPRRIPKRRYFPVSRLAEELEGLIKEKKFSEIAKGLEANPHFKKPNNESNVSHWVIQKDGSDWIVFEDCEENNTDEANLHWVHCKTLKDAKQFARLVAQMYHYGWGIQVQSTYIESPSHISSTSYFMSIEAHDFA